MAQETLNFTTFEEKQKRYFIKFRIANLIRQYVANHHKFWSQVLYPYQKGCSMSRQNYRSIPIALHVPTSYLQIAILQKNQNISLETRLLLSANQAFKWFEITLYCSQDIILFPWILRSSVLSTMVQQKTPIFSLFLSVSGPRSIKKPMRRQIFATIHPRSVFQGQDLRIHALKRVYTYYQHSVQENLYPATAFFWGKCQGQVS